jgi:uncharacterized protein
MEQRLSLVTLGVRDLGRARAFYEALGWTGARQPDDEVAFFQAGGMIFGLWTALGGHGAPGIELAQNVRAPEEVDALLAEAERAGATIVRPAARADWGGYTGAFADPDGYVWEVAHNPGWSLAADGSVRLG